MTKSKELKVQAGESILDTGENLLDEITGKLDIKAIANSILDDLGNEFIVNASENDLDEIQDKILAMPYKSKERLQISAMFSDMIGKIKDNALSTLRQERSLSLSSLIDDMKVLINQANKIYNTYSKASDFTIARKENLQDHIRLEQFEKVNHLFNLPAMTLPKLKEHKEKAFLKTDQLSVYKAGEKTKRSFKITINGNEYTSFTKALLSIGCSPAMSKSLARDKAKEKIEKSGGIVEIVE